MSEVLPGYQQTEFGTFPDDWQSVTLASTASRSQNAIVGGPFGSDLVSADYTINGVPVIRGQNMGSKFIDGEFVFVSPSKAKSLTANCASAADLIFTQRGTLGQVSIVPNCAFQRYVVSQSQMKLTVDKARFDPEYFYYYFSSPTGQRQVMESAIQTGVPHTNLGILRQYRLPVPTTLGEQKAIAQALSDIDDLIASLDALISKKRDIKHGAMQQLLTGKRRLPGFSGEWVNGQVGDLASCLRGVSYNGDADLRKDQAANTRMLLRSNNIYEGKLVFKDVQNVVSERVKIVQILDKGDILICMANGSKVLVGKSALIDRSYPNLTFGAFMGCLRPLLKDDGLFLHFLFQTERYRAQIADVLSGSSINNLSPKQIEGLSFVFPDFDERVAIAECLQSFELDEAAHQMTRDKLISMRQGMMQQLLTGRIRLV